MADRREWGERAASLEPSAAPTPLDAAIAERDHDIVAMVRRALYRRDVILAYQPVVDARDTSRIAFHEGLLRVLDDTGRIIPAREFIGACETNEVGRLLDIVALEAGLSALADTPELRLSINVSARSFGFRGWMAAFEDGIAADPTVAERLILEVVEASAVLLPELTMSFMEELQVRGVAFALDDFGAGVTSFRHLRDLDFDILKVTREFATGVAQNPDNRVLYEALVAIARHFDMFLVAEGVESAEDADTLCRVGVDCLQGYAFGAPSVRPPFLEERGRRRRGRAVRPRLR